MLGDIIFVPRGELREVAKIMERFSRISVELGQEKGRPPVDTQPAEQQVETRVEWHFIPTPGQPSLIEEMDPDVQLMIEVVTRGHQETVDGQSGMLTGLRKGESGPVYVFKEERVWKRDGNKAQIFPNWHEAIKDLHSVLDSQERSETK